MVLHFIQFGQVKVQNITEVEFALLTQLPGARITAWISLS